MKWLVGEKCHGKTKMDPAVRKPSVVRKYKNIPGRHKALGWAELCECGIAFWRPWASCFLMLLFVCFSVLVERLMFTGCLLNPLLLTGREAAAKDLGRVWMPTLYKDQKTWKLFLWMNYPIFFCCQNEVGIVVKTQLELNPGKLCPVSVFCLLIQSGKGGEDLFWTSTQ